jgi:HK97 family phage portal protein
LLDFLLGLFRRRSAGAGITTSADLAAALERASASGSGVNVTQSAALSVSAVYACVRVIAETLASVPISIYQRSDQGRQPAPTHPLYDLLHDEPNEWQTALEFVELMQAICLLRGNAFAYINRATNPVSGKTFVAELLPLHPDRVEMVVNPGWQISYKIRLDPARDGEVREVPRTSIFHLRGISYGNGFLGVSPLAAARETFGLAIAAQTAHASMFANGVRLSGVLKHPGQLDEPAIKQLKTQWEESFGGVGKTAKTAVLEEGMDFEPISMSAADAQLLESRKFSRSEIAALFRVPPHMIGDLERATFSNIEQQGIDFVRHCLMPWARRWEQAIRRDLIDKTSTYYAKFNLDALMRGDLKSRYEAYATARMNGWLSANDIRELEDMNPIGPQGNVYWQPSNTFDAANPPAPAPTPAPPPVDPKKEADDEALRERYLDTLDRIAARETTINVTTPPVKVEAPVVNVAPAAVNVTTPPVDFKAGDVKVDVHVPPPPTRGREVITPVRDPNNPTLIKQLIREEREDDGDAPH